jgi:hypothetical protein
VDSKAELDNRKKDIWQGYHALVENYARMVRGGGRWDGLGEVLQNAIAGLSYDLAVLQANHMIDRGFRGEEAMRVFRDEADEILEEVSSAWRAISGRFAVALEDDAQETKRLAQPFHRVRDDLRRLLHDMPVEAAGAIAQADTETADKTVIAQQDDEVTGSQGAAAAVQPAIAQPESSTEIAAGDRPTKKPRQYGFAPDMGRHRTIAGIVERHVPDWRVSKRYRESDILKLICRDLDMEAADFMPESWKTGNNEALDSTPVKNWTEALELAKTGKKLVCDQIESSLNAIRRAEAETL